MQRARSNVAAPRGAGKATNTTKAKAGGFNPASLDPDTQATTCATCGGRLEAHPVYDRGDHERYWCPACCIGGYSVRSRLEAQEDARDAIGTARTAQRQAADIVSSLFKLDPAMKAALKVQCLALELTEQAEALQAALRFPSHPSPMPGHEKRRRKLAEVSAARRESAA